MKKNILPKILFISLMVILVSGCNKWLDNEFHPLPANRYPAYAKGDTFMYKSIVTEDIDTFVISDLRMDTVFNGSITFERTTAVFGEIVADTFGEDFFLIANEPYAAVFRWDSSYAYFVNVIETLDTTIQGFVYNDLFFASSPRQDTTSEKIYKIYFDWEYGLVKYVQNTLDTYELFYRGE